MLSKLERIRLEIIKKHWEEYFRFQKEYKDKKINLLNKFRVEINKIDIQILNFQKKIEFPCKRKIEILEKYEPKKKKLKSAKVRFSKNNETYYFNNFDNSLLDLDSTLILEES